MFDAALDAQMVCQEEFDDSSHSVVLTNVTIEEGHIFEARVWVPQGMIVRIQSIEYERLS